MWSKKRIPVVIRAFPRPSRSSFSRMSVSFVFRWIVAVRAIFNSREPPRSRRRLPFLSNDLEQLSHLRGSSHGDAHEPAAHILAAIAKQDSLFFQLAKKRWSLCSQVCQ